VTPRLLKIRDVVARTSLSRPTIYRLIERGEFPRNRKISPQRVAWPADAVDAWIRGEWESTGASPGASSN
jgi:prophage regulatory protein